MSTGKYYPYEHEMFSTFYLEYKALFEQWGVYDENSMYELAISRLGNLGAELLHLSASNNKMHYTESILKAFSYYDDVIAEAAALLGKRKDVEERIINTCYKLMVNAEHLVVNEEIGTKKLKDSGDNYAINLIEASVINEGTPALRKQAVLDALLDYRNPYRVGLYVYEDMCGQVKSDEDKPYLEYFRIEEQARIFMFLSRYELAADEIGKLFEMSVSTPEKYVLLAVNCVYCGFTDDALDAVNVGLELYPGYQRLIDVKDQITDI